MCDEDLIRQAVVCDIDYGFVSQLWADEKIFSIRTDGSTYYARSVVLAVGAGNAPSIPKPFPASGCPCACHAFQPQDKALMSRVRAQKPTNVLVIGGGLTSAQIADRAIRQGATRVLHLMRGPMKGASGSRRHSPCILTVFSQTLRCRPQLDGQIPQSREGKLLVCRYG